MGISLDIDVYRRTIELPHERIIISQIEGIFIILRPQVHMIINLIAFLSDFPFINMAFVSLVFRALLNQRVDVIKVWAKFVL